MFQPPDYLCGLYWTHCSMSVSVSNWEGPKLATILQMWSHGCWIGRVITSFRLVATLLLIQPGMDLAAFTARALVTHVQLVYQDHQVSLKLFFSQLLPSLYCCLRLCHARCRALHLPFLNFMRFLSTHFYSLSTFLWITVLPFSVLATAMNLRVHSIVLSRLLRKLLNNFSLGIDPWGMPLVFDWQWDFVLLITTPWFYQSGQFSIPVIVHLPGPYLTNLAIGILWVILSEVFLTRYYQNGVTICYTV